MALVSLVTGGEDDNNEQKWRRSSLPANVGESEVDLIGDALHSGEDKLAQGIL